MSPLKTALVLVGQSVLILVLAVLLVWAQFRKKPDQVALEIIKTNYIIRERLIVLTNEAKKINAEDALEKKSLDSIGSLTNDRLGDPIKLFLTLQTNQLRP